MSSKSYNVFFYCFAALGFLLMAVDAEPAASMGSFIIAIVCSGFGDVLKELKREAKGGKP